MKMLLAMNVEAGVFMQNLADAQNWPRQEIPDGFSEEKIEEITAEMWAEGHPAEMADKAIFGRFYRRVRVAAGLSQAVIADRASYSTRSLIAVESGLQEPMVMRALQLVWVMGADVKMFMNALQGLHRNLCESSKNQS